MFQNKLLKYYFSCLFSKVKEKVSNFVLNSHLVVRRKDYSTTPTKWITPCLNSKSSPQENFKTNTIDPKKMLRITQPHCNFLVIIQQESSKVKENKNINLTSSWKLENGGKAMDPPDGTRMLRIGLGLQRHVLHRLLFLYPFSMIPT